jgi:hypothetical protein
MAGLGFEDEAEVRQMRQELEQTCDEIRVLRLGIEEPEPEPELELEPEQPEPDVHLSRTLTEGVFDRLTENPKLSAHEREAMHTMQEHRVARKAADGGAGTGLVPQAASMTRSWYGVSLIGAT